MPHQKRIALLLLLAVIAVSAGVVAADGSYEITVENGEVDVPEREVSVQGQNVTVTSVAPVEQGETLDVSTSTTKSGPYDMILYDSDQQRQAFEPGLSGDASSTFQTDNLNPGTYGLVIFAGGGAETVQPVVIEAYQMSLSVPSEANRGENISAEISLDETDPEPEVVEVVLANETIDERVTAEQTAEGEYTARIPAEYETGEYRLYAAAREESGGSGLTEAGILSMSDEKTLTISESDEGGDEQSSDEDSEDDTSGEEPSSGGDGNEGGNDGGGATDDGGDSSSGGTTGGAPPTNDSDTGSGTGSSSETSNGSQQATVEIQPDANSTGSDASFENTSAVESVSFSSNVTGTVEVTTQRTVPTNVASPPGDTIYVSEITVPESARNTPSTIRVRVSADRVSERNVTAEDLRVSRLANGTWTRLETSVIDETAQTIVLDAETPGFSMFAVTTAREQPSSDDGSDRSVDDSQSDGDGETDGSDSGTDSDATGDEGGSEQQGGDNSSEGEGGDTIDPADNGSESGGATTDDSTPGFGVVATLLAVVMLMARARGSQ